MLQGVQRRFAFTMHRNHSLAGIIEQRNPAGDEAALAGCLVLESLGECGTTTAAILVAEHHDFGDFELRDGEFKRGRDAVATRRCFERRHHIGDISDNEDFTGRSVKDDGGVYPAVRAGDNHQFRALSLCQFAPPLPLQLPTDCLETAITFEKPGKVSHRTGPKRGGRGWQVGRLSLICHRMSEADPVTPPPRPRKPDWIRVKAPLGKAFSETRELMRRLNLATVCEEAACPNIGECWTKKHATVMILGDTCTRACAFCNVKTGMPRAVDLSEPQHVADAAAELGLQHIVVTSVDRDDLPDGGAKQFVKVIEALRRTTPGTTIEILTPDFRNKADSAIEMIVAARPDVYNHNLETVPRLYPTIRPGARYYASLRLLETVKRLDPTIFTKSGVMVGLGEERLEVHQVMDDMRSAGIDFLTMGQYLQPTGKHAKVAEFVTPKTFEAYAAIARAKGFLLVAASPLTRSSYHAGDDFVKLRDARTAELARKAATA